MAEASLGKNLVLNTVGWFSVKDPGGLFYVGGLKEAYSWVGELEASKHTANVHCDGIECHVYAMRMKSTAWKVGKFAKRNAHIPESARSSTACFYVGQTGLRTVEERFIRHIGDGKENTMWGRNHFLRPFGMAHDEVVRLLNITNILVIHK